MVGGLRRFLSVCVHWVAVVLFAIVLLTSAARAQNTAAISQGFKTTETNMIAGALISLKSGSDGEVELANTDRSERLVGVAGDKSLVALQNNTNEVQVVINGVAGALVSNINGDIKSGDKITASPINGVGMKATASTQVVGIAQEDFSNIKTAELTIKDRDGKDQIVRSGLLPIQVNVTYFATPDAPQATFLPGFLQQVANSVAGREVSVARVLISLLILLLGFVAAGVLLYSSVQSSIISIGRNPLSEDAVHKSLWQVGLTALGVLLVMVITIYLILRI